MAKPSLRYGGLNEALDKATSRWLTGNAKPLLALYKDLHANPELSGSEKRTAGIVAGRFRDAGLTVTEGVGGYGVVGVLTNGSGPTILIRGDMDALPVEEETGLPYRSRTKGVMHACGHDVHTSMLTATAAIFAKFKDLWRGTVLFVAQPSEETVSGAQKMINDRFARRFPRPDAALALHVAADLQAGVIDCSPGWAAANVDTLDVTIFGKGGHGADPHLAADPVVAAAYFITALQTIVSRRVDPIQPAVVTVGSIHAGSKHNIIPDKAVMQLTIRTYSDEIRKTVLSALKEIAANSARAAGCTQAPKITEEMDSLAAVYNDPPLSEHSARILGGILGAKNIIRRPAGMGGEDFGVFGRALGIPALIYSIGVISPTLARKARRQGDAAIPSLHNSKFAPVPGPTLKVAVRSMCAVAGSLLGKH